MKRIAFVFSTAPHGTASGREGLDALLATSALTDELAVFFIADGVFQLLPGQKPDTVLARDYIATFKLLGLYDIERCWVETPMLHTLHRSPWLTDFPALLRLVSEGDELLLLQDGVTAAVDGNRFLESLRNAPIKVYALNEDLIARGLVGQISNDTIPIDYTDFVRLTVKHTSQLAW